MHVRAIAAKSAGEDLEQVAVIPVGLEAFGFDPASGHGLVLQERPLTASARRTCWAVPTCNQAYQQSNTNQQMSFRNR